MLKSLSNTTHWSAFQVSKYQVQADLQKQAIKTASTNDCKSESAPRVAWPVKLKAKKAQP